jgi:magnesium-protoporphyrin O-methyltransferase
MANFTYLERRTRLKTYFDRTAVDAWARLTTDAPVSGIRATVRKGREEMRALLMSWLPERLDGTRLLDAGCGTGLLAIDAARRGAAVTAIDLSPTLIGLARERTPDDLAPGSIVYHAGDMLDPPQADSRGFDYVVAMDSLIHYQAADVVGALARIAGKTNRAILITFAPRTPLLTVALAMGRAFPKTDRSPEIEPVSLRHLESLIAAEPRLEGFKVADTKRVSRGFYTSQALLLTRTSGGRS